MNIKSEAQIIAALISVLWTYWTTVIAHALYTSFVGDGTAFYKAGTILAAGCAIAMYQTIVYVLHHRKFKGDNNATKN